MAGVLTVLMVESLQKTGVVREDAAIGLVFPALFSVAVLLISIYSKNVHLDMDAVLVGKIALTPLPSRRLEFGGYDFDTGTRISESYAKGAKMLAAHMLKNMK